MALNVRAMKNLEIQIYGNLKNPSKSFWKSIYARARKTLTKCQKNTDLDLSNKAWFLSAVSKAWMQYVDCYELMVAGKYYEAWCGLERVEITIPWLIRNPFYDPNSFGAEQLLIRVRQWQSLFPYKVFFSPGLLEKRKECSICNHVVVPWVNCGHNKGYVYGGYECFHIVKEVEFLEISLVLQPVQKYSVALYHQDEKGNKIDGHDYSVLRFLCERLDAPFDNWRAFWTTAFHPHNMFPLIAQNEACPCNSGKTYENCCLPLPGVKRPHVQFEFEKMPSPELPMALFSGYGSKNGPAVIKEYSSDDVAKT